MTIVDKTRWMRIGVTFIAAVAIAVLGRGVAAQAPQGSDNTLSQLRWRFIGPTGNRVSAVAGVAGNPFIAYAGAASGGIWKTENGGTTWRPIFDREDVSAIGALAVSESSPNVVWAGTGETFLIRPFYPMGDGVYMSNDAGEHWQRAGLEATGHIARIVIDPHDAQRVFVCALGQLFKPQPERGVYRTTDGGKTWTQVLAVDANTGCSDIAIDPNDPNVLVAGMWALQIHPWSIDSGGATGGIYMSRDGGNTWKQLAGNGLPPAGHPVGKVAVAIAHSTPSRVYALVQDTQPSFYRSDDSGATWTLVSPLAPHAAARLVLRSLWRLAVRSGPALLPESELHRLARRRKDVRPAGRPRRARRRTWNGRRTCRRRRRPGGIRLGRRRQSRHLDRSEERGPHHGRQRRRRLQQHRRRAQL
ncbi:MAG: WD40/YVTN/BNR-like repeat-containing protein [Vicinamibacterales bacterium]